VNAASPVAPTADTLLGRLFQVLRAERRVLLLLACLTLMVHGLRVAVPLLTRVAVDQALPSGTRNLLRLVVLGVILLALHRAWLEWLRHVAVQYLDARLEASFLSGLLTHLFRVPLPVLGRRSVGELMQAFASASAVSEVTATQFLIPLIDGVVATSYLVLIAANLPGLAAALGVFGAFLVGAAVLLGRTYAARQRDMLIASARQRTRLYELIEGATTLKALAAERRAGARWMEAFGQFQRDTARGLRTSLWLEALFEGGTHAVTVTVLIWGGVRCLHGALSVGVLLSSLLLAQSFLSALSSLSQATLPLWGLRSDARRVDELLALPALLSPGAAAAGGEILMEDVWFRYSPSGPWILRGYSLRIAAGTLHEITGPSGIGKTTILRLLAGFYQPERGRITVGGRDPSTIGGDHIGYVQQQPYLFEGSLLDNLLVLSQASRERVLAAARLTGLASVVEAMRMQYDTRVPPGGGNLSGGQRQLVILTACVASCRPVILLDEAFSHLDRLSRERLRRSDLLAGRTVVSVEHDVQPQPPTQGTP
jgi:subfamily B ATP-binding cassette protein HlyB/CyaB